MESPNHRARNKFNGYSVLSVLRFSQNLGSRPVDLAINDRHAIVFFRGPRRQIAIAHVVAHGIRVALSRRAIAAAAWTVGGEAVPRSALVIGNLGDHFGHAAPTGLQRQPSREAVGAAIVSPWPVFVALAFD